MIAPLSFAEGPGVNVLKPHQKGAVITLLENEVSQHEISRKTGIDRKTVRKLAQAMAAARSGEGSKSPMATGSDGLPVQIPPPRPPALGARPPPAGLPAHARSACEGHREWIEAQVRLGRNAMAIYQELVDRFGFRQRYNSVKRFCRTLRTREPEQFDRLEFLPGEECQVDYGEGALTGHRHSGRHRRPRLFIMTFARRWDARGPGRC
jgi:transposase